MFAYSGITPAVDSCARLVYQKAQQAYKQLPSENKRYIDFEDLVQEGLLAAWKAEQTYDPDKAKYSTYVFNGLNQVYLGVFNKLKLKKRASAGMSELDASPETASGDSSVTYADLLEDGSPTVEYVQEVVSSTLAFFAALDDVGQRILLELLSGRIRPRRCYHKSDVILFRKLALKHWVYEEDLSLMLHNADVKAQVIEGMSKLTTIEVADARLLLCSECNKLFSLADVRAGRYVSSSLACQRCLQKLQAQPVNSTCFGKAEVVQNRRVLQPGFSESNAACRLHCRDRVACRQFARKRNDMTGEAAEVMDGLDVSDVTIEETEEPKVKAKAKPKNKAGLKVVEKSDAKKQAKTGKVAKAKKVVKAKSAKSKTEKAKPRKGRVKKSAAKIDPASARGKELIKANLDEKGRDLPYKALSNLRRAFVFALKPGRTLSQLRQLMKSKGVDADVFVIPALRSGKSGDTSLRPYPSTHTWKVNEDDGQFHIHGVKRIACYERLARINLK